MKQRTTQRKILPLGLCLLCLLLLLPGRALAADTGDCFPACGWDTPSLADALRSVGADSSFAFRAEIARANGYRDYQGTAEQNTALLYRLRNGRLRRPASDMGPLAVNQAKVCFLRQEARTCKATAVAMAMNLLRGGDFFDTSDMGGTCCRGIGGEKITGSDGRTFTGVYKTDAYAGSLKELTEAVEKALAAGIPIVAPVHSVRGGTQHHWVLVLGRSGGDYLIADPARRGSGTVADNAVTMASRGYAFGLSDEDGMHYGYVTFLRT